MKSKGDKKSRGRVVDAPRSGDWRDKPADERAPICADSGGKTKAGKPCTKTVEPGRNRCKFHGGRALRGPDHPNYKHGGRMLSRLPIRMREAYQAALESPDLLEQRPALALLDARTEELLGELDRSESGKLWEKLNNEAIEFRASQALLREATEREDLPEVARARARSTDSLNKILRTIADGAKQGETWDQILSTVEQRRKVAESERRRIEAERAYVPFLEFLTFVLAIQKIHRESSSIEVARMKIGRIAAAVLPGGRPPSSARTAEQLKDDVVDAEIVDEESEDEDDER